MKREFKFINNLKYSTARLFKDFSKVQTIIKTHKKKPRAMCNFQNYYHTSQTNP